jgi:hypothetical protein
MSRSDHPQHPPTQTALPTTACRPCLPACLALVRRIRKGISILSFTKKAFELFGEDTWIHRLRQIAIKARAQDLFLVPLHGVGSNSHYRQ